MVQIFNAKRREGAMLVKLANKEQQIVQLKVIFAAQFLYVLVEPFENCTKLF